MADAETQESISPAWDVKEFSSFGADIDLTTSTHCTIVPPRPARALTVVTAGSGGLVLQMVTSSGGAVVNRTLSALTDGEKLEPLQIRKIISSGTTVTKVRVYW